MAPSADACTPDYAPGAYRLLTRAEYDTTVRAVLAGLGLSPSGVDLPVVPPARDGAFKNRIDTWELTAEYTEVVSTNAARYAGAIAGARARLAPSCAGATPKESDCVQSLITVVGRTAYRHNVAADEQTRLSGHFTALRASWPFEDALAGVIEVMLTSPAAFHLSEIGQDAPDRPGVRRLTAHETAQAISYALTQGPPDTALATAADMGQLTTAAEVEAQVLRLIDVKKSTQGLTNFFIELFSVGDLPTAKKDSKLFPFFTPQAADLLLNSFTLSANTLVSSPDATLEDMLNGKNAFVRKELAPIFGTTTTSTTFASQMLGPERGGLFLHPAYLAAQADLSVTHPPRRARHVLEGALCMRLPDPPPEAAQVKLSDDPKLTNREKLTMATSPSACTGCHGMLNPIGFALDAYDAAGRYQPQGAQGPIDTTGSVSLNGRTLSFKDAPEVVTQLSTDDAARGCFVTNWYQYLLGRDLDKTDDCSRGRTLRAFQDGGWKVRPVLRSLFTSDTFLYRKGA